MQQSLSKFSENNGEKFLVKKILFEYGYDKKDVEANYILKDKLVDLAVFTDSSPHTPNNCWIVALTGDDKEEATIKLKQIFKENENIEFAFWTDGRDIQYFKRTDNKLNEVFNIPKKGKSLELPKRTELKEPTELSKTFSMIHNHIYANDGLSAQEAFNEVLKLLFIKVQDGKNEKGEFVKFGISEKEYNQIMNEQKNSFKERIESLFAEAKKDFSDVFNQGDSINLKDSTLAFVVGQLQNFNLSKSKKDIKGAAFQKFIYAHQRGSRGQFFTPDPIIQLAVNILKPTSKDKIIDPACGTAGFLVEAMKYVYENELVKNNSSSKSEVMKKYAHSKLRGMEINPTLAKVAKMRMILEDDGYSGIMSIDSLSDFEMIDAGAKKNKIEGSINKELFDLVLTNPPFGTQGKITNKKILKKFELGHKWSYNRKDWEKQDTLNNGQVPDILFVERCLDLLKSGGKLAIVLPTGDLENKSLGYVRQYIDNRAKLLGIVSLPQKTFIPHGTGIKAVILFIEKLDKQKLELEKKKDYELFFSIIENVGYEGNKNGTPIYMKNEKGEFVLDNEGNPKLYEDMSFVCNQYENFLKGLNIKQSDKFFIKKYSELKNRWDAEYYAPRFSNLRNKLKKAGAVPLKSVVKIISNRYPILKMKGQDVRYIEINNINPITNELHSYSEMKVHELPSRATFEVKEGDILTAVSGISTGTPMHASAYVTPDFNGCISTNGMRALRPININSFYLLAYIKSDLFLEQMLQSRTGAAIPSVCDEELREVLILLPSKEIQEKIAKKVKESYDLKEKSKQVLTESKEMLNSIIV